MNLLDVDVQRRISSGQVIVSVESAVKVVLDLVLSEADFRNSSSKPSHRLISLNREKLDGCGFKEY